MKNILISLAIFMSAFLFIGCATIFGDKTQNLSVNIKGAEELEVTVQDGAGSRETTIEDNDILPITKGTSPVKILVDQDECKTAEIKPERNVEGIFFLNIISGGVLGSTTDYSTGKMWRYEDVNIIC